MKITIKKQNVFSEFKTRSLIWELTKRTIRRTFKIIWICLKSVFGLYRHSWSRSRKEFAVLMIMTLAIIGTIFYVFKTREIKLTRAVEIPRVEAKEVIKEPIKQEQKQQIDTTAWAVKIDNYLASKNSPLVSQGAVFVQAGIEWKIDPDLLVAICGADTSFGKQLATPYNIGNVGNDDSGNRVGLGSWGEGIYAIAKVLNNQYLGSKQTIGELSYGGGGKGNVYATSPYNWNKNVKAFMSELKGSPIDEGYQFRNFTIK